MRQVGSLVTRDGIDVDALALAMVDGASEMLGVIGPDFTLVAVNRNLARVLGYTVDELLGRAALDLIAAEDVDRAVLMMGLAVDSGSPPGTAAYRFRHADGSSVPVHITGCDVTVDGRHLIVVVGRPTFMPQAVDTLLDGLLAGQPLAAVLGPIVEFFAWRENGSAVAISWREGGRWHAVGTPLPPGLDGGWGPDGLAPPWERAVRTGEAVRADQLAGLDDATAATARAAGLHSAWIEPVAPAGEVVALLTVWTSRPGLPPQVHAYAVDAATRYVTLVLQWTDHVRRLDHAAHRDALTGLANRRAFFDALAGAGPDSAGAVLYCDLDGFKPVNDAHGHAAGDALLVEVGRRIAATVREDDLVARLGGDEFGVVLWGATPEAATRTAERIRAACAEPVAIAGAEVDVRIGVSIGTAHVADGLGEATVEAADRALYDDKRRRTRAAPGSAAT